METIYYDPRNPGSFTSVNNLQRYSNKDRSTVQSFLSAQDAYSVTIFVSDLFPDIRRGLTSIYVYCDAIEPVVVGDSKVQLLRTLPFLDDPKVVVVHQSFTNPLYVPVQKKHFDSIEVNIITDTGDPVPFTIGKSIVVLHFRRSSNPYVLLSK